VSEGERKRRVGSEDKQQGQEVKERRKKWWRPRRLQRRIRRGKSK
jgi:hypothetical protein